jgi:hypothetical protein
MVTGGNDTANGLGRRLLDSLCVGCHSDSNDEGKTRPARTKKKIIVIVLFMIYRIVIQKIDQVIF